MALPHARPLPDSVPDSPRYSVVYSESATFALSIPVLYAKLGRGEAYAQVMRDSHTLATEVRTEGPLYSSEYSKLDDVKEWFNGQGFGKEKVERGVKRLKWSFAENLNFGVTTVRLEHVGTVTETEPVDLDAETVTVVHTSHAADQKLSTRKVRTFTKLPAKNGQPQTRIDETEYNACSRLQAPIVWATGPYFHRRQLHSYHKLFPGRSGASYNEQRWGVLAPIPSSLPDAPPFNIAFECAVSLNLPLEDVYEQLGRVESLERVIRRHAIVVEIDVDKPRYSSKQQDFADIYNPLNLPGFESTEPGKGGLKRAAFIFSEVVQDYWPLEVLVVLEGSQVEQQRPDFASGEVSVLYVSYARKQGMHVRKLRTFTRMPDVDGTPRTKVHEKVDVMAPWTLWLPTWLSSTGLHRRHMLAYGGLWKDQSVKAELA